jgi:hypothetical protein
VLHLFAAELALSHNGEHWDWAEIRFRTFLPHSPRSRLLDALARTVIVLTARQLQHFEQEQVQLHLLDKSPPLITDWVQKVAIASTDCE